MWEISVSGQVAAFLFSLVLGAVLSLVYDIIRVTRKIGLDSFAQVFIGDVLFFSVSAVVVFIYLVGVTNGEIRGYVIFSVAIGFALYRFTVGRAIFYLLCKFSLFLSCIFKLLSGFLFKFFSFCEKPVDFAVSKVSSLGVRGFNIIKKLLKNISSMLYTTKDKRKAEHDIDEQGK